MKNPDHKPRAAYCFGCDHTFPKMHLMIWHRRLDRCGGRFLSPTERLRINILRSTREKVDRELREFRASRKA